MPVDAALSKDGIEFHRRNAARSAGVAAFGAGAFAVAGA